MKKKPFFSTILYEDADYFVVNKPALVSTLSDSRSPEDCMLLRARKYYPEAQVCHRLDKATSGALAFAKHAKAYRHLAMAFEHREVKKVYHAVVEGVHNFEDTYVEAPIYVGSSVRASVDYKKGKAALTVFTTLAHYWKHTLVECCPLTGRTHQIRLHAAFEKAPIVGDALYGGKPFYLSSIKQNYRLAREREERPLMARVALHAFQLGFCGLSGERIAIEAPYAKDFKALLTQLGKN